ncbi:MAG TPA: DUF4124 domain-containing protein [Holophagaceae bacterium]|nr:DUF4124 domain-containing protein [Holophagaceae bacterium]
MPHRLLPLLLATALGLAAAPRQDAPARPSAPKVYRWKDEKGKIQITNTPPPPGAPVLEEPPPPMALESDRGDKLLVRQSGGSARSKPADLNPEQQAAWEALDKALGQARRRGDKATLQAVVSSLISESRWSNGLGFVALMPAVALALMGLMGWWIAFNLPGSQRRPLIGAFVFSGLVLGQLMLCQFLYRPQFFRMRLNLTLLTDFYLGGDLRMGPKNREAVQAHWSKLEAASSPLSAPWRFPAEVSALEDTLKRVVVEP